MLCATLTTVLLGGKPRVIAEFFAFLNIAFGNNPDGALGAQNVTVGVTGVVDVAGFVLQGFPINIIAVVEGENVLIALVEAFGGFVLGNSLPDVLNNPRAFFDILSGEESFACDARRTDPDPNFHTALSLVPDTEAPLFLYQEPTFF